MTPTKSKEEIEKRIYCKYCGAKLKEDRFGLICPEDWTHNNDEAGKSQSENHSQQDKTEQIKDVRGDANTDSKSDKTADTIQQALTEQEIIDFYKGRDVDKADKLLLETAKNNFKVGQQEQKKKFEEFLEEILHSCDLSHYAKTKIKQKLKEMK